MAPTRLHDAPPEMPVRTQRHVLALGLTSFRRYEAWCRTNGFAPGFEKSRAELEAERDAMRAIEARR